MSKINKKLLERRAKRAIYRSTESYKTYQKAWKKKNKDKMRQYSVDFKKRNPEYFRIYLKKWNAEHPEYQKTMQEKYRSLRKGVKFE